jgi:hypothetical protein
MLLGCATLQLTQRLLPGRLLICGCNSTMKSAARSPTAFWGVERLVDQPPLPRL